MFYLITGTIIALFFISLALLFDSINKISEIEEKELKYRSEWNEKFKYDN